MKANQIILSASLLSIGMLGSGVACAATSVPPLTITICDETPRNMAFTGLTQPGGEVKLSGPSLGATLYNGPNNCHKFSVTYGGKSTYYMLIFSYSLIEDTNTGCRFTVECKNIDQIDHYCHDVAVSAQPLPYSNPDWQNNNLCGGKVSSSGGENSVANITVTHKDSN